MTVAPAVDDTAFQVWVTRWPLVNVRVTVQPVIRAAPAVTRTNVADD